MKAKIINNIPFCPECEVKLARQKDYRLVNVNDKNYCLFIRQCDRCNRDYSYCISLNMEESQRLSFSDYEVKEV